MTQVEQVGGSHYAADYQHWDWAADTRLPYLEGCASKYLPRWRQKNGLEDLRKAQSYLKKALLSAQAAGELDRLAGFRTALDHDARERFIESAGVPEEEAEIIRHIDVMTEPEDVDHILLLLESLIIKNSTSRDPDRTGMEEPFGYQGDG